MGKEKDFQFSYARRITRPTFNDIAPFVFFWNTNTFSAGNTSLWPAISDAIKVGYHANQWIISLQFSHAKKEMVYWQPEKGSESNILTFRTQNLNYLNSVGLTNSYSLALAPWWNVQSNLTAQYQVGQTSHLSHNVPLYMYSLNLNVINVLKLPKDFAIEISGLYQSRALFGISENLPLGSLNAGIQKKMGDKGTVRIAMDDILHTNYWRLKTNMPQNNLNSTFTYDWHYQFVRVTYSRNFGNNKLRSVRLKSGSEEEKGRVN